MNLAIMHDFCHLHCHTEYSLLDGAAKVNNLVSRSKMLGMHALAITDHGNMFGVPHFVSAATAQHIKPIIGCEFYLAQDRHNHKDKTRYHQVLLAKNSVGYQNLVKLCSLAFLEGYYYKPRIDKKLLEQHKEGLIATTCCLSGQVPRAILKYGESVAEKVFLEWLELFGDDYYIELQRHAIDEQDICNAILLRWSKKYHVPVIATNDVHYILEQDSTAQDVLLCLQTGKDYHDPYRMRFTSNQFFLKSPEEMTQLFADIPQAIENTLAVAEKIETLTLARDILLPICPIPDGFLDANAYLNYLTFQGAKHKFGTLSLDIEEKLHYELTIISQTGFAGYFLIVRDLIDAAHRLGVVVGPGRGSVVGSLVAFCLGITKVDPLQYQLLFERFLNPERISMPDIDIDFDDEGRKKVIDYVVEKYGRNRVAYVITFGSMAAKSAIRDVARVLGIPLARANYLAKLIPDRLGITLAEAFQEVPELAQIKQDLTSNEGQVLTLAETLEGATRHTGIHAAGIIIAPYDLVDYIPVKTDKNTDLLVTQYEGAVLEQVGMLKMDLLGLKTLSIIRDALYLIQENKNHIVDIDRIPLDDPLTLQLYKRGNTRGTFQFESEGIRQWLVKLQPENIEELIAMNALYRPGPMQFIPSFIARKHGTEPIDYPHPLIEPILKSTYGIMVYQEQIMQTAQILAGYSLGEADLLRRAMGKKKVQEMATQRDVFVKGAAQKHGIPAKEALHIFDIMERFAQYGFNRSHSAAYTLLAYQTAYLKAHYPEEYMAAVLTHHQGDLEKIALFMDETQQQGIKVLGPDINKSNVDFCVDGDKHIRFGLGAIKGVGRAIVETIIETRQHKGQFKDIYDFIEALPFKTMHKKTMECLALSGALECFEPWHRKQYIYQETGGLSFIEKLIQYAHHINKERIDGIQTLFENPCDQIKKPQPASCTPYSHLEQLALEKSLVGCYITGHPLEEFAWDINQLCNVTTQTLSTSTFKELKIAGLLIECLKKHNKKGQKFAIITLEDRFGILKITLWPELYEKYKTILNSGEVLLVVGHMGMRYRDQSIQDFQPKTIYRLQDIRTNMVQSIQLKLEQSHITSELVEALEQCIQAHPGRSFLKFLIQDQQEQIQVDLLSRQYTVQLSNALLVMLSNLSIEFGFSLTQKL